MKITDIRTMLLTGEDPHGIGGQSRTWNVLVVRVDTDNGLYGLGEAPDMPGVREAIAYIRGLAVGRSAFNIRPLVTEMLYGVLPPTEGASMSPTATPTGPIVWGVSGVEVALCDVVGKALGVPVYDLLGGKYRDRITVYLDRSGPLDYENPQAWRELGRSAVDAGWNHFKFDIDFTAPECTPDPWNRVISQRQMNRIVERLSAVREAVGPDVEIAVDGHMYYNVPDSIRLASDLAHLNLMWLEDPTPITNPDALAEVRAKSPIPICAGEMFIAEQFRLFIDRRACDIIHPDVLFVGGLHEALRVGQYADLNYMPMAIHNNGSGLNTIAAAHVAAATPNFLGLEYHFFDAKWIGQVIERGAPLFEEGQVRLTDQPGLGVQLNREVCCSRLAPGEEWIG